jgi:uncharacterized protein (TIGR03435 family)
MTPPTRRHFLYLASASALTLRSALAQSASPGGIESVDRMPLTADPAFEVATVRPSNPDDQSQGFHTSGRSIYVENMPLDIITTFAYDIHPKQLANAPAWFSSDRYDIKGVPDAPGQPNLRQQQTMLRKLLADRFHLKAHHEQRDLSIYALTVLKSGPKLKPSTSDPNDLPDQTGNGGGNRQFMRFTNNSMQDFARGMGFFLDRPVIDQTHLPGKFDFRLEWTPDTAQATDAKAAPGLFTAIQEQLGLKLEAVKGPADILVIDHVERPTAD